MNASDIRQLKWIDEVTGTRREYRAMIVGWQNIVSATNALIGAFNTLYLAGSKRVDIHKPMREIAIKKLVIASLYEMRKSLLKWYSILKNRNVVNSELEREYKEFKRETRSVDALGDIRNNVAFHSGDPLLKPDDLIRTYSSIHDTELKKLNKIWKTAERFGNSLKRHISKNYS